MVENVLEVHYPLVNLNEVLKWEEWPGDKEEIQGACTSVYFKIFNKSVWQYQDQDI